MKPQLKRDMEPAFLRPAAFAVLAGLPYSTVTRNIRIRRRSAKQLDDGSWRIPREELSRVLSEAREEAVEKYLSAARALVGSHDRVRYLHEKGAGARELQLAADDVLIMLTASLKVGAELLTQPLIDQQAKTRGTRGLGRTK